MSVSSWYYAKVSVVCINIFLKNGELIKVKQITGIEIVELFIYLFIYANWRIFQQEKKKISKKVTTIEEVA